MVSTRKRSDVSPVAFRVLSFRGRRNVFSVMYLECIESIAFSKGYKETSHPIPSSLSLLNDNVRAERDVRTDTECTLTGRKPASASRAAFAETGPGALERNETERNKKKKKPKKKTYADFEERARAGSLTARVV